MSKLRHYQSVYEPTR